MKGDKIVAKRLYRRDVRRVVKRHVCDFSRAEVVKAYRNSQLNNLHGVFLDRRYRALPTDIWKLILEYTQIDKKQYVSEYWDCDDYAKAFAAQVPLFFACNGVGIVYDFSGGHAYNAILVADKRDHLAVVGVEPQNDGWGIAQTSIMYKATQGYTIF